MEKKRACVMRTEMSETKQHRHQERPVLWWWYGRVPRHFTEGKSRPERRGQVSDSIGQSFPAVGAGCSFCKSARANQPNERKGSGVCERIEIRSDRL